MLVQSKKLQAKNVTSLHHKQSLPALLQDGGISAMGTQSSTALTITRIGNTARKTLTISLYLQRTTRRKKTTCIIPSSKWQNAGAGDTRKAPTRTTLATTS
jgi:hypothetical protein